MTYGPVQYILPYCTAYKPSSADPFPSAFPFPSPLFIVLEPKKKRKRKKKKKKERKGSEKSPNHHSHEALRAIKRKSPSFLTSGDSHQIRPRCKGSPKYRGIYTWIGIPPQLLRRNTKVFFFIPSITNTTKHPPAPSPFQIIPRQSSHFARILRTFIADQIEVRSSINLFTIDQFGPHLLALREPTIINSASI